MCYFITATLPIEAPHDAVKSIVRGHGRNWVPVKNESIGRYLAEGEQYFYTTKGHCDCDTSLGSSFVKPLDEEKLAKQVAKLQRKRWSQTKIDRWVVDKERIRPNRTGAKDDAAIWVRMIREVFASTSAKHMGLLLHMYSGDVEDEDISITRSEDIPLAEVTEDRLHSIQEDVLYRFLA